MASLAIRLKELEHGELEEFIEAYASDISKGYDSVLRLGQASDKGRDVVGFRTARKHEGGWDLFQSKRKTLGSSLAVGEALNELGKVFFHHCEGAYATLPERYVFVTPRGVAGPLRDLILNPSTLQAEILAQWTRHCSKGIVAGRTIPLSAAIAAAIGGYDFSKVSYRSAPEIVRDPVAKVALTRFLNLPPDDPPIAEMHPEVQGEESEYVGQLRRAYDEGRARPFSSVAEIQADQEHGNHFREQRERFFSATWFERNYRDSTAPTEFDTFKLDVYHGSIDVLRLGHPSCLARVHAVMKSASQVTANFAGSSTRSYVRQGVWHTFVNEGKVRWVP